METTRLEILFRLVGHGWAECDVALGKKRASLTASYLSDALGQLAAASVLIKLGSRSARVSFDEEPGEFRWGFDWCVPLSGQAPKLRIRIWAFDQLWGLQPDDEGRVLFDEFVDEEAMFQAVLTTLDDVLKRHGEEGYKELWVEHPFPIAMHRELRRLLEDSSSN